MTQINDHLWEGRYSPKVNGKRMARNVYAQTEAECEEKLAELIRQMKVEIAEAKQLATEGRCTEVWTLIERKKERKTKEEKLEQEKGGHC